MQATPVAPETKTRFDEPVLMLLRQKEHAGGVWFISPEATVYEAIERMSENHIGALAVLSAQKLAGIISERDYARKVILKSRQSRETRVHEIMSKAVYYVNPMTTIDECMRLMTAHHVRHLPVLEGDEVVDMVSMSDLVSWIIQSHEHTIQDLGNYIRGKYPA